ncbi:MAG: type II toxin-antitoxin system prevent-host-death family antitoxin [Rhodocyclaceae bacterium]|nr:type II toxin-antitoxin system prevent-host-death family antitoxin [Rhodocyclaceae bacterium]
MKTIGIFEATNTLSQLVDQAASGEEIVLTRNGKPVARLAPVAAEKALPAGMDWLAQSCAARLAGSRRDA